MLIIGFRGFPIVKCHRPTLSPVNKESNAYTAGRPRPFLIIPCTPLQRPVCLTIAPITCNGLLPFVDVLPRANDFAVLNASDAICLTAPQIDPSVPPISRLPDRRLLPIPPNVSNVLSKNAFTFAVPTLFGGAPLNILLPPQNVPLLYVTARILPIKSKNAALGFILSYALSL